MFGVCGNELSADGHVVDKQYGCGAHSDTPAPAGSGSPMYEPYDDGVLDVTDRPQESAAMTPEPPPEPESQESPPEPTEAPEPQAEPPEPQAEPPEPQAEPPEPQAEPPEPQAGSSEPRPESQESPPEPTESPD
jgi:outer membrane biosynthesis protein TonB